MRWGHYDKESRESPSSPTSRDIAEICTPSLPAIVLRLQTG
jgi:hypothetical protein